MPIKIVEIKLKTRTSGEECVERDPPSVNPRKQDVDVIRIRNINPTHTGSTITVTMDSDAGDVFDNPPASPQDLDPGESLVLIVRSDIHPPQSTGFTTDPDTCQHHDAGDIVIQ